MAAVPWLCKGSEIPIFLDKGSVQRLSYRESLDPVLSVSWIVSENSDIFLKDEKTP